MARVTIPKSKTTSRAKTSGSPRRATGKAASAPAARRAAVKPAAAPAASKEELRARIEKLERANATLRVKNKDLRLAYVEASEQVDSLTLRVESLERRLERQARQEPEAAAPARRGSRRAAAPVPPPAASDVPERVEHPEEATEEV